MKTFSTAMILLAAMVCAGATAAPVVIDFDDLLFSQPVERGDAKLLNYAYQGFSWSGGWGTSSWAVSNDSDNYFSESYGHGGAVTVSGHNYAWSNAGQDLTISRSSLFDVTSLWVRQGYDARNAVTFIGLRGNGDTFNQQFTVGTTYQLVTLNFNDIVRLEIRNGGGNLLIEDISVNVAEVPEPSTLPLLVLGLCGIGFLIRKKQADCKV